MTDKPISVQCLTCNEIVTHDPRRITGCGCDPDANTWVYIEPNGSIQGLSAARWQL